MTLFQAIILAIIEGLTEFLPVSSTGHMIIASWLMGIEQQEFVKLYTVAIQLGAILSVVVLYVRRFFTSINFYVKLAVSFLPTAVLGLLLDNVIDSLLGNVLVVGISLLLGGIVLIFIDKAFKNQQGGEGNDEIVTYKTGVLIGLWQSLAMVPGVSRSAASIIGGQVHGLSRKAAAEFSFFLAVPTMLGATVLKLYKGYHLIAEEHIATLLIGNSIAFIVGMLAIRFFISFLTRFGFRYFGYYRVVLGLAIVVLYLAGVKLELT